MYQQGTDCVADPVRAAARAVRTFSRPEEKFAGLRKKGGFKRSTDRHGTSKYTVTPYSGCEIIPLIFAQTPVCGIPAICAVVLCLYIAMNKAPGCEMGLEF